MRKLSRLKLVFWISILTASAGWSEELTRSVQAKTSSAPSPSLTSHSTLKVQQKVLVEPERVSQEALRRQVQSRSRTVSSEREVQTE